jgi:hypothetical protein
MKLKQKRQTLNKYNLPPLGWHQTIRDKKKRIKK